MPYDALQGDLCVLLTPRSPGGHEAALLGWLADAARQLQLRPAILAATPELAAACTQAGLADALIEPVAAGSPPDTPWQAVWQVLRRWPADRPLLLAPGTLHAQAWLLAAAVLLRRQVWVYVPMAFDARHMGLRHARWRDRLLAPWLRRVSAWITIDARQQQWLQQHWRLEAPVHRVPNRARLGHQQPAPPGPAEDGRLRVAYVGRFDPAQKGLDWLVASLLRQPAWATGCRWTFQGRGAGEADLLELASTLGPQHVLVQPQATMAQALASNDVLLLPSRFEGVPLVALEAITLGWPVVASRGTGLETLLPDDALFDFGDADGLQRALLRLRCPAARGAAVAQARQRLATAQAADPYDRALQRLVRSLTAASQPAAPC